VKGQTYSHKGSKVTRLLFTNPRNRGGEWGGTKSQGKGSLLSQVTGEQKIESWVGSTYYL